MSESSITKDTRIQLGLVVTLVAGMLGFAAMSFNDRQKVQEMGSEFMRTMELNQAKSERNAERLATSMERTNEELERTNKELASLREAIIDIDGRAVLRVNLLYWIESMQQRNPDLDWLPFPKR